ncbi:MAG: glycosyltransferase family 4 protein [Chloroflexi bacterium]|nr:glycosyltransferase family 4 protein [Chloroflexota bacterium]
MAAERPRLLIVSDTSGNGGLREVIVSLSRQLPALGWEVVVVLTGDSERDRLPEWLDSRNLEAILAPNLPNGSSPATWLRRARVFRGLAREHRPALINVHYAFPHVPAWDMMGVASTGVPAVATLHIAEKQAWRLRQSNRLGARLAASVTGVSESVAAAMRESGMPPRRVCVIPNGIPVAVFERPRGGYAPAANGTVVIGCVARLDHWKRVDVLIDAVAMLDDLPVELVLVGDGRVRADLERRAAAALPGRVRFRGQRQNIAAEYASFDILALTSDREGLPLVLLEGAAAGLPVVATSTPGSDEAVADGVTGILAPAGDVEAVASALRRLVEDPVLRARMGAAGRTRVAAVFSEERMARDYDALFREVLGRGGSAAQ